MSTPATTGFGPASGSREKPKSIVLVLMQLKLQLMQNSRVRAPGGRSIALALNAIFGAVAGILAFCVVAASSAYREPIMARGTLVLGATLLAVAWTVFPIVLFGVDDTLDPARLVLLPLRRRPLVAGLLLASLIGVVPTVVLLGGAGAVLGYGRGIGFPIVLAATALAIVFAAALGRTCVTLLATRLSSRRGRDAVMAIGVVGLLVIQSLRFAAPNFVDEQFVERLCDIVRWLPPGMLGEAILAAHHGRLAVAAVQLLPAAILLPVLLVIWGRALERSLTVVTGGSTPPERRQPVPTAPAPTARPTTAGTPAAPAALRLVPRFLRSLPSTPWVAVAARELRYVAREPRHKLACLQIAILGLAFPVYLVVRAGTVPPGAGVLSSAASYLAILASMNSLGMDGEAMWLDVSAGDRVHDLFLGKNLAAVIQVVPVVAIGAVILSANGGGWAYVPAAVLISVGTLGVGFAAGNVMSVYYPMPVPDGNNPFASPPGSRGCLTAIVGMVSILVQGLLLAPIAGAAALALRNAPVALAIVAPASLVYGTVVWMVGTHVAASAARQRQPEILALVGRRASGPTKGS